MTNFNQDFMSDIGPRAASFTADILDVDRQMVSAILSQLVPLLLSGLKRQRDDHGGMDRIDHILNQYGGDHIFDDLSTFLSKKAAGQYVNTSPGGLLGRFGPKAETMLALKFDLDRTTVARVIHMNAPVILGFLSQKRRRSGIGLSGISAILDRDADSALLDDLFSSFLRDQRHAANTTVLAELLKGLTSPNR